MRHQAQLPAGGHEPPAECPPVFKWAGGKRWLIGMCGPAIRAYLDATGGRYFEPFLGGGALGFWLGARRAQLGDIERPLIEAYQAIGAAPDDVAARLAQLARRGITRERYELVRAQVPRDRGARAARLLYLNRLAYNGLYRVNRKGRFNVPFGRYAAPSFPDAAHLHRLAAALPEPPLHVGDFQRLVAASGAGDVVFADPPYMHTFRSYSGVPFGPQDHERLAGALRAAAARGAAVIATNSDTPELRCWYAWAHLVPTAEPRAISCKAATRSRSGCLLLTSHLSLVWPQTTTSRKERRDAAP